MSEPKKDEPTLGAALDSMLAAVINAHNQCAQRVIKHEHDLLRLQLQVDALQTQLVEQLRERQAAEDRLMAPPKSRGCH